MNQTRRTTQSKKKKKDNGTALKSGVVIILLVVVMIGYYYYLSNRQKDTETPVAEMTVAQELIARNLETKYPPTPKEVVRYYSEITKCFYNETYSDGELEQLADQARNLYDAELVANNEWGQYMIELKSDIDSYKEKSIRVTNYVISSSTDVEEFSQDGYEFARLYCTYVLSNGTAKQNVEEVFLLRKDEEGHWKIYGWDLAENVTIEE